MTARQDRTNPSHPPWTTNLKTKPVSAEAMDCGELYTPDSLQGMQSIVHTGVLWVGTHLDGG